MHGTGRHQEQATKFLTLRERNVAGHKRIGFGRFGSSMIRCSLVVDTARAGDFDYVHTVLISGDDMTKGNVVAFKHIRHSGA